MQLKSFITSYVNLILIMRSFNRTHRCTRVENPGRGVAQIFAKILRGPCFLDKIARMVHNLGFISPVGSCLIPPSGQVRLSKVS
jgi:hypothetical protein